MDGCMVSFKHHRFASIMHSSMSRLTRTCVEIKSSAQAGAHGQNNNSRGRSPAAHWPHEVGNLAQRPGGAALEGRTGG
eukprot:1915347-Pyramimonas_sp.AAC.1